MRICRVSPLSLQVKIIVAIRHLANWARLPKPSNQPPLLLNSRSCIQPSLVVTSTALSPGDPVTSCWTDGYAVLATAEGIPVAQVSGRPFNEILLALIGNRIFDAGHHLITEGSFHLSVLRRKQASAYQRCCLFGLVGSARASCGHVEISLLSRLERFPGAKHVHVCATRERIRPSAVHVHEVRP
ncbi:hypothetical protein LMG27177_03691 [Paraburkholderia fynbosensis]|uniref:Uncharacterized protein n=1 Tax=Paraburkholderia fynbosensis TaxID=1200993 RepID=A0A6J5GA23_9BURK|nr:hypothetical protein LMG27177_03691 [Paraburkholderia fynbosensis]